MGSEANRLRKKWQDYSGKNAGKAEQDFFKTFKDFFEDTDYEIIPKPKEFNRIYVDFPLKKSEIKEIYNPTEKINTHGIFPDYAIRNKVSGKAIYVEVKRQDGWVEGKKRSAGRGNAHERLCKYFTPGLSKILQRAGHLQKSILPFWVVFQGDITRDPCRVREISCWFDGHDAHFFFWRNTQKTNSILEHFINKIMPLLD